jgi:hypothetical protein
LLVLLWPQHFTIILIIVVINFFISLTLNDHIVHDNSRVMNRPLNDSKLFASAIIIYIKIDSRELHR